MAIFTVTLAALLFVTAAWLTARIVLGWYTTTRTYVQCDSCHAYAQKREIRWYAGDPVCPRCRQELATDPRA